MNIPLYLLALSLLLAPGSDLEFSATARRINWKLKGKSMTVVEVEILAKGPAAAQAIATRGTPEVSKARSTEGKTMKPFVRTWSSKDASWISRGRNDPADEFEFDVALLEPEQGTAGVQLVEGKVEVLLAKGQHDLLVEVPLGKKPTKVKSSALGKARASLEVWTREREALFFDFHPKEGTNAKVLGVDLDRKSTTEDFFMWSGVTFKKGHFSCPGKKMGKGITLTVRCQDTEGNEFTVRLERLKGGEELERIENEQLEEGGIVATLQGKTLYEVHARAGGTPYAISDLELTREGQPADRVSASRNHSSGLRTWEFLIEAPSMSGHELVGRCYGGLKWKTIPFRVEDVTLTP